MVQKPRKYWTRDTPEKQKLRVMNDMIFYFSRLGYQDYKAYAMAEREIRLNDLGVPDMEPTKYAWESE